MDTPLLLVALLLLLPLITLLLTQLRAYRKGKNGGRLPPGPFAMPFIVNWQRYSAHHLVARYGPVVSLRVGTRLIVLVSDRRVAHAALVETGAALADRPAVARSFLGQSGNTISRSSYGPVWRLLRRNLVSDTLHPSRRNLFAPARAWARRVLVDTLLRASSSSKAPPRVRVAEELRHGVFCLLVLMCFGERLSEHAVRAVAAAQRNWVLFTAYGAHVFAFWPAVTKILFRRRFQMGVAVRRRQKELFMPLIDARRERKKQLGAVTPKKKGTSTSFEHPYVDTLFDMKLPNEEGGRGLTDDEIVSLCSEFLFAGTDTTSTALQWIMAELVKNPTIQEKLCEGVDVAGTKGIRMMPFGAGRRICAGLGIAMMHLEYFVANLVREFEWHEVPGDEVDLAERHEITTVMKKPLRPRLVPRRIHRAATYASAQEE